MDQPKRRLSAVWFADIVGYTSISSLDEPAALQLVGALQGVAREVVATHEGRIVKFIGDAVLAEFSSAESAVRAAVSLQESYEKEATELGRASKLRVGVHLGEVNATPDGDLYGDGINTAARLQGEAEPGQVLASEDVWRQLRQRPEFRFAPLGAVELKGITTRVEVYDVLFGGRAALAARAVTTETRPSKRTRTGMHPALRVALVLVPLVVGGTLLAQKLMSPRPAPTPTATLVPTPPPTAAPAPPETILVVRQEPAAPTRPERPEPRGRADRASRQSEGATMAPIRAFLEEFVTTLSTRPPRVALERAFPGATAAHARTLQQMRQNLGDTVRLRLGPIVPRAMRGDTADVRFFILAAGPRGKDVEIPFEALIVPGADGFHFTELRRAGPR